MYARCMLDDIGSAAVPGIKRPTAGSAAGFHLQKSSAWVEQVGILALSVSVCVGYWPQSSNVSVISCYFYIFIFVHLYLFTTTVLRPLYRSTCISRHNCRILFVQSFTSCIPLLTATSTFALARRCFDYPQQCYLLCLRTFYLHIYIDKHIFTCTRIYQSSSHATSGKCKF